MTIGIVMALVVATIGLDVLVGFGLRQFYRRWRDSGRESLATRFLRNLHGYLRSDLQLHYLFNDHKDLLQSDGTYAKVTLFDPYVGWRWPVNTRVHLSMTERYMRPPPKGRGLFTNRFGIIGNDRDIEVNLATKTRTQYRVFVLGGSSLAGIACNHVDTWTGILNHETITAESEKILNSVSHNVKFQIINVGVLNYRSVNEFLSYATEYCHYPHDMVVTFHGWNDAQASWWDRARPNLAEAGFSPVNALNLGRWSAKATQSFRTQNDRSLLRLFLGLAWQILTGTTLAILARFVIYETTNWHRQRLSPRTSSSENSALDLPEAAVPPSSEAHPGVVDAYARRLVANDLHTGAVAASEGVKFVSILQPTMLTKTTLVGTEMDRMPSPEHVAQYGAFIKCALECYCDPEGRFHRSNFSFFDWSRLLDDSSELLYCDMVHYSDKGIAILAQRLAEVILAVSEVNPDSRTVG